MNPTTILEFSRNNCLGICALLVPASLIATSQTLILVFRNTSPRYRYFSVGLASFFAILQILHVASWFVIGIVTPVSFILLSLSSFCLFLNLWTASNPLSYRFLLNVGFGQLQRFTPKKA